MGTQIIMGTQYLIVLATLNYGGNYGDTILNCFSNTH